MSARTSFNSARGQQGAHLARWMMFVDGEGLAIRGRELLHELSKEPDTGKLFEPDIFLWTGAAPVPRQLFQPLYDAPLEEFAIRWHYYTALQGDDVRRNSVRDRLQALGFDAHVFKKTARKSKGVDITLARDFLSHAYRDNFDAAVLVAGDADFVPLVEEVKRLGKQVFVLFFAAHGTGDELKRHADTFFDFEPKFRDYWVNAPGVLPWSSG
ncbi:MAG: NYN domain-containing protein [Myxococcaceae bacterium]